MQCAYMYDIDQSSDASFPLRLIGEIRSFSYDLLNMDEDEFNNFFFDNELIFQLQSAPNKQTYFCESMNNRIVLHEIIPKRHQLTYENPLIIKMMHSYTRQKSNDIFTTPSIVFTPMSSKVNNVCSVSLGIDVLISVTENMTLGDLAKLFIRSVNRQILDFKKSYAFHRIYLSSKNNLRLITLHYLIDEKVLTLILPEKFMNYENDLCRQISKELKLEKCLSRYGSLYPPQDVLDKMSCNGDKLINPHLSIVTTYPDSHLVKGRYTYYHYLQDGQEDKGWGCAYRSLQTIVSWYVWQGYRDLEVPSLRAIQESLVRMRDKEESFVGSRAWIGSFEINLVLQDLIGVESRILSLGRGSELEGVYDELVDHFDECGAPVMIGGGQLAHTILGVSRDRSSKARFLVLDPHYLGPSRGSGLATVLGKGWCAWKELSFWKDTLPYNLCVPGRPSALCL